MTLAYHAVVKETVANMNLKTLVLIPKVTIQQCILDKHYLRKHAQNNTMGKNKRVLS